MQIGPTKGTLDSYNNIAFFLFLEVQTAMHLKKDTDPLAPKFSPDPTKLY